MSVRTGDCHAGVGNEERHSSTRRQPLDPGEHGDEPCPGQIPPPPEYLIGEPRGSRHGYQRNQAQSLRWASYRRGQNIAPAAE
jgi:hypothetical protein